MPITNTDLNRLLGDGPSNGNRLTSKDVQRLTGTDAVPSMTQRRQFNAQRHQIQGANNQQIQEQREYNDRINQNVQQLIDLDDPDTVTDYKDIGQTAIAILATESDDENLTQLQDAIRSKLQSDALRDKVRPIFDIEGADWDSLVGERKRGVLDQLTDLDPLGIFPSGRDAIANSPVTKPVVNLALKALEPLAAPGQRALGTIADVRTGRFGDAASRVWEATPLDEATEAIVGGAQGDIAFGAKFFNSFFDPDSYEAFDYGNTVEENMRYDADQSGEIGTREAFGLDPKAGGTLGSLGDFVGQILLDPLTWVTLGQGSTAKAGVGAVRGATPELMTSAMRQAGSKASDDVLRNIAGRRGRAIATKLEAPGQGWKALTAEEQRIVELVNEGMVRTVVQEAGTRAGAGHVRRALYNARRLDEEQIIQRIAQRRTKAVRRRSQGGIQFAGHTLPGTGRFKGRMYDALSRGVNLERVEYTTKSGVDIYLDDMLSSLDDVHAKQILPDADSIPIPEIIAADPTAALRIRLAWLDQTVSNPARLADFLNNQDITREDVIQMIMDTGDEIMSFVDEFPEYAARGKGPPSLGKVFQNGDELKAFVEQAQRRIRSNYAPELTMGQNPGRYDLADVGLLTNVWNDLAAKTSESLDKILNNDFWKEHFKSAEEIMAGGDAAVDEIRRSRRVVDTIERISEDAQRKYDEALAAYEQANISYEDDLARYTSDMDEYRTKMREYNETMMKYNEAVAEFERQPASRLSAVPEEPPVETPPAQPRAVSPVPADTPKDQMGFRINQMKGGKMKISRLRQMVDDPDNFDELLTEWADEGYIRLEKIDDPRRRSKLDREGSVSYKGDVRHNIIKLSEIPDIVTEAPPTVDDTANRLLAALGISDEAEEVVDVEALIQSKLDNMSFEAPEPTPPAAAPAAASTETALYNKVAEVLNRADISEELRLADFRNLIGNPNAEDFKKIMLRLLNEERISLMAIDDPVRRTKEDIANAINLGGDDRHLVFRKDDIPLLEDEVPIPPPAPKANRLVEDVQMDQDLEEMYASELEEFGEAVPEPTSKPTVLPEPAPMPEVPEPVMPNIDKPTRPIKPKKPRAPKLPKAEKVQVFKDFPAEAEPHVQRLQEFVNRHQEAFKAQEQRSTAFRRTAELKKETPKPWADVEGAPGFVKKAKSGEEAMAIIETNIDSIKSKIDDWTTEYKGLKGKPRRKLRDRVRTKERQLVKMEDLHARTKEALEDFDEVGYLQRKHEEMAKLKRELGLDFDVQFDEFSRIPGWMSKYPVLQKLNRALSYIRPHGILDKQIGRDASDAAREIKNRTRQRLEEIGIENRTRVETLRDKSIKEFASESDLRAFLNTALNTPGEMKLAQRQLKAQGKESTARLLDTLHNMRVEAFTDLVNAGVDATKLRDPENYLGRFMSDEMAKELDRILNGVDQKLITQVSDFLDMAKITRKPGYQPFREAFKSATGQGKHLEMRGFLPEVQNLQVLNVKMAEELEKAGLLDLAKISFFQDEAVSSVLLRSESAARSLANYKMLDDLTELADEAGNPLVVFGALDKPPSGLYVEIPELGTSSVHGKYYMHKQVADEYSRTFLPVLQNNEQLRTFERLMQRWSNAWATMVTVSPLKGVGFHARNFYGNMFNMFLAGVNDPAAMVKAGKMQVQNKRVLAHMKETGHTYEQALEEVIDSKWDRYVLSKSKEEGIMTSGYYSDLEYDLQQNRADSTNRLDMANPLNIREFAPFKAGRTIGRNVENNSRMALFQDQLSKGFSPSEAGQTVRKFLFDYKDITPFERRIKNVSRFYTFMRKNLPLQVQVLMTNPGRTVNAARITDAVEDMFLGEDQAGDDKLLPEWAWFTGMEVRGDRLAGLETPFDAAVDNMAQIASLVGGVPVLGDALNQTALNQFNTRIMPSELGPRLRHALGLFSGPQMELLSWSFEQATGTDTYTGAPIKNTPMARAMEFVGTLYPAFDSAGVLWGLNDEGTFQKYDSHEDFWKNNPARARFASLVAGVQEYKLDEDQQHSALRGLAFEWEEARREYNETNPEAKIPTMEDLRELGTIQQQNQVLAALAYYDDEEGMKRIRDVVPIGLQRQLVEAGVLDRIAEDDEYEAQALDDQVWQASEVRFALETYLGRTLTQEEATMALLMMPGTPDNMELEALGIEPQRVSNRFLKEEEQALQRDEITSRLDAMARVYGFNTQQLQEMHPLLADVERAEQEADLAGLTKEEFEEWLVGQLSQTETMLLFGEDALDKYRYDRFTEEDSRRVANAAWQREAELRLIYKYMGLGTPSSEALQKYAIYGDTSFTQTMLEDLGLPRRPSLPRRRDARTDEEKRLDANYAYQSVNQPVPRNQLLNNSLVEYQPGDDVYAKQDEFNRLLGN